MVVFNYGKPLPEDLPYRMFPLRKITFPQPDSLIYTVDDLVEDIYACFDVPDNFRDESGHEIVKEMLWDLYTERSP
jgi:hypothetical protein